MKLCGKSASRQVERIVRSGDACRCGCGLLEEDGDDCWHQNNYLLLAG